MYGARKINSMTIRTEGQIVGAANAAQDLTNLVVAYLELYKKHAQGLNGVKIPTEKYTVIFRPILKEGYLPVTLVYTKTTTWRRATHYDVDDDMFDERLGADNISGYTVERDTDTEEYGLAIPFNVLLRSREDMERDIITFAAKKRAEIKEAERQAEIARHEAAIAKLKAQTPSS